MNTDQVIEARGKQYGDIKDNDTTVLALFYLRTGIDLPKGSYPVFLQCVKIMREWNKHDDDNTLDFGAYRKLEDTVNEA